MRRLMVAISFAMAASACGKAPAMIPVKGLVKIDHQAAAGVLVFFWPDVSTKDNFGFRHAVGITDSEGHFFLKCSRDGLLGIEAGEYHVTFSKSVDPPGIKESDPLVDEKRKSNRRVESVPIPYSDHAHPKNSPSQVAVSSSNANFTFDLPGPVGR
jgi:hypothetical protein